MNCTNDLGQRRDGVISMGTLESDDCCGVGLANYGSELSPRRAFEDFVPSVSKAEWARPPPYQRGLVFNRFPIDTSQEDACIDSGVALSGPQADVRVRSFSTSSNIHLSSGECRSGSSDEELLRLDMCNLLISDKVETNFDQKGDRSDENVRNNDIDDYRINWDFIFEQDEEGDT